MLNRKRLCRFPFLLDNNTMAYSLSYNEAGDCRLLQIGISLEPVDLTSLVQVMERYRPTMPEMLNQ